MKSFLILLLNFLLSVGYMFGIIVLELSTPDELSMVPLVLVPFAIYLIVFFPAASYLSMKKHFSKLRYSFLYSLLVSLSLVCGYSVFGVRRRNQLLFALGLFLWCELWALIGMIKIKRNKQSEPEENDDGYI